MKKLLLLMFVGIFSFSQQYVEVLPNNGATSPNGRAPQGAVRYIRTCYVISPTEMTASGFPSATAVTALSFEFFAAQNITTTGDLKIYIQNTTDATYSKASNDWTDVINGMTLVHDASTTIPSATGFWNIPFSGGSTFTYTGSGVYVAFEYSNPTGDLATTANNALCNTAITDGLRNTFNNTGLPATIASPSNWRPATRFAFTASCLSPSAVTVSNLTATSATVSFTAPATPPAEGYEYYLSTSNTAPTGATVPTGTTTTTSISLTGLTAATTYHIWVRSACSTSSKSVWTSISYIDTAVLPPYETSFENNELTGWTLLNAGTGNQWGIGNESGLAATGTNYAVYGFHPTNAANAWLFSREIELLSGTEYEVKFKVRCRSGSYPESMKATVGNARTVAAHTTTLWDSGVNGINYTTYTEQTGTFTPSVSGVFHLGFHCYSAADQWQLLLDDVSLSVSLSIKDNEFDNSISIAPIPVYGYFNLKSNIYEIKSVNVLDINGRIVKNFSSSLETYDISNLTPGVYFVQINGEDTTSIKKIIKK